MYERLRSTKPVVPRIVVVAPENQELSLHRKSIQRLNKQHGKMKNNLDTQGNLPPIENEAEPSQPFLESEADHVNIIEQANNTVSTTPALRKSASGTDVNFNSSRKQLFKSKFSSNY